MILLRLLLALALAGPPQAYPAPTKKPLDVHLTWQASPTAGVTYRIYRSDTAGGPYTVIAADLVRLSYDDTSVKKNRTYYYVARSWDGRRESVNSNEFEITMP